MYFLYNIIVNSANVILKIVAIFNKKIHLFIEGRKDVFKKLESHFSVNDAVIWFHCASLGEFEQGRPIIEKTKSQYPNYKILVTFFSPSGYEIRKDYATADLVTYLPFDTKKNVKKFLEIVNPQLAIFVKYEFWPNLLKELQVKDVKTVLVSGIFRKNQSFFKSYGGWMKKSLKTFDHFFVQNQQSKDLLKEIGFENVTISGDTRFDRVYDITKQDNNLEFVKQFIDNKTTLIAGSTWPKDEELLVNYINTKAGANQKFIIAPHNIHGNEIEKLKRSVLKETVLYSEIDGEDLSTFQVLIIDTIGLLSKVYKHANIAYVGGGFGAGIHNLLEPATFGIPIIIGPNYHKFKEAKELIDGEACIVITNSSELNNELTMLFTNVNTRINKGNVARNYVLDNTGATFIIIDYIDKTIIKKK